MRDEKTQTELYAERAKDGARQAKDTAHRAVRDASPWLIGLGRFGYAAKGVVYVLVGGLAAQAAVSATQTPTDSQGALQWIESLPFGQILLGATAIGLAGYALWRFVQAMMDTENKGTNAKGIATRIAYAVIGLIYAGLSFSAVRMALGAGGGSGGDSSSQSWTAWLLAMPFGQWLVGLVGAIIIGVGLFQFYQAYSVKFREKLLAGEMSNAEETWTVRLGRIGYAARGIVFVIIGGFLILAAVQSDASETRGLGGALFALARQPYGPWLLGLVALGLMAYGIFMLALARYRRMVIT